MTEQLSRILEPESVAVVGASKEAGKRGHQTIVDLEESGYGGAIYPVNPKYDEPILGREVYASVAEIPDRVDLAFVAVPAGIVPGVIEDCGEAGVAGAVVIAAGFSELGEDDLERRLVDTARERGVRVIGPNIQGIANVNMGLNLLGGYDMPAGDVAVLSQSGNMALDVAADAETLDSGLSFNVGIGNESDLGFQEFLPFLAGHEETASVVMYVDGMADARAFLREAREFVTGKPIVVIKGGMTDAGGAAAESHTASLAGSGEVIDAVYGQAGVTRLDRIDEAVAVAGALASQPAPPGTNAAVLTDGGGNATFGVDALTRLGIDLPELEPGTQDALQERVPLSPNVTNPVDIMGVQGEDDDLFVFADTAEIVVSDPNVDVLLLTGMFGGYESYGPGGDDDIEPDVVDAIADLSAEHGTPIVVHALHADLGSPAVDRFRERGVPVFGSLDVATTCVAELIEHGEHVRNVDRKSDFELGGGEPDGIVAEALEAGRERLSEHESKRLLADRGAPVAPFELAETAREAAAAADRIDGPVAMKIASPDIVHKTDAGGVELDVTDDVQPAFERITANARAHDPDADLQGVLVSPMLDAGVELILGVAHDPEVGPVVAFGLGGVFTEVLEDVAFRALPLTEYDARRMIEEIRGEAVLEGARGGEAVDREALIDLLLTVSELVEANPAIAELDLNPVFARPDGVEVVDATVHLEGGSDSPLDSY